MPVDRNVSRRQVLAAGCAVAVGLCAKPLAAEEKPRFSGFIDAHSHAWSSDTVKFPVGPWVVKDQMKPASFTAEQLLEIARPQGVDRVVLVQHSPYFGYDPAYLIDCWKRYPGVFSIIAMIDERKPDLADRLRQLRQQGVRGIRINAKKRGDRTPVDDPANWLNEPGMQALWKQAQEQHLAICPIIMADSLPTLSPMCEKFPDVTCVIDHCAQVDTTNQGHIAALLRLARHRNVMVKIAALYKLSTTKPPYDDLVPFVRRVVDAYGPDRMIWGSDCPYQLDNGNTYRDSISLVHDKLAFLTESERQAILRDNAERIFFQ